MPTNPIAVTFVGLGSGDKPPETALYSLDANGAPSEKLGRVEDGKLGLDPAKLKGLQVAIGPDVDDPKTLDPATLLRFRGDQAIVDWQRQGVLIPKDRWPIFIGERICVSGHVRKCRPWWWDLVATTAISTKIGVQRRALSSSFTNLAFDSIRLPWSCQPICEGIVEVFERVCCCTVIDYDDLVAKLRAELLVIPAEIKWPVPPRPDPGPVFGRLGSIRNAASVLGTAVSPAAIPGVRPMIRKPAALQPLDLTKTTVSARIFDDYRALLKLPRDKVDAFVDARPYLAAYCCSCAVRKVGETAIRPGGDFDFCYRRIPHIIGIHRHCYTTFAYRVKQQIAGVWTVVYDGVAGHDYFAQGENADIRTSNPAARPCGDGPPPPDTGDGRPFVMLEHVTGAGTHHFNFPAQTGLSQVGALDVNDGLYNFGGLPDCPWATSLGLRLWVSPSLFDTVVYYRFKAVPVSASGAPVGTPVTLTDPVAWSRFITVAGDVVTTSTALDALPADVGGEVGLFKVPYWRDGMDWLSGQYHQIWNTAPTGAVLPNGRYLLMIELFGPGGARIKPNSAPAAEPGTGKAFQFRRWDTPTHTLNVPHADCAHVFWIDNTPVNYDGTLPRDGIYNFQRNGVANTDECQFISGPAATTISVGFRAYHLNGVTTGGGAGDTDSFMAGYSLTWQRGLNGPQALLDSGTADRGEAGPVASASVTIGTLLGPGPFPPDTTVYTSQTRCTFSVHLHVDAKHHNGGGWIDAYDYDETASFALEITSGP